MNERKEKILKAIIENYIATGEPVGSRFVSKLDGLGVSPATIRNEMSDLEEEGYLVQPHISAGRIPTDKGYRYYVDNLMDIADLPMNEKQMFGKLLKAKYNELEDLIADITKLYSKFSNYTFFASEKKSETVIKKIEIMPAFDNVWVLVMVTNDNNVTTKQFKTESDFNMNSLAEALRESFVGKEIGEVNTEAIDAVQEALLKRQAFSKDLFSYIMSSIFDNKSPLHLGGVSNLLSLPEYSDVSKAKDILEFFEAKENLEKITCQCGCQDEDELFIRIGEENETPELNDCSVVATVYKTKNNKKGSIGIIGPKRMDYKKTKSELDWLSKLIEKWEG